MRKLWDSLFHYSSNFCFSSRTSNILISDLLTDQEVIKSKRGTLSGSNELANLISLSLIILRVMAFEKVSWIFRQCRNEVVLEMTGIEVIYRIIWHITRSRYYTCHLYHLQCICIIFNTPHSWFQIQLILVEVSMHPIKSGSGLSTCLVWGPLVYTLESLYHLN